MMRGIVHRLQTKLKPAFISKLILKSQESFAVGPEMPLYSYGEVKVEVSDGEWEKLSSKT